VDRAVIDASIAVKWVVQEDRTAQALALRTSCNKLLAPDLLIPECANILWKKVKRGELIEKEALLAARLLAFAPVELVETRNLLQMATELAIQLDHPAYDCIYMALASAQSCPFITADEKFACKVRAARGLPWSQIQDKVRLLAEC
jgi:predicted nucleic acid-binding protein